MNALLVVAHPDDEALYFGGLLLKRPHWKWHIVCVTDGNGDGRGRDRQKEFARACRILGAAGFENWGFKDLFDQRLDVKKLQKKLEFLSATIRFNKVFTHSPLGEYGHPHHQDVSFAVHQVFQVPYSTAYNTLPDLEIRLGPSEFATKCRVLWDVYNKETRRFMNFLDATAHEGFSQVSRAESEALYQLVQNPKLGGSKIRAIKKHRWLVPYLKSRAVERSLKAFFGAYF